MPPQAKGPMTLNPLVDLTPALDRHHVNSLAVPIHREDNPPASNAALPETAPVGEQIREPRIIGRFGELVEAVEDALPGAVIHPVEILGGPVG